MRMPMRRSFCSLLPILLFFFSSILVSTMAAPNTNNNPLAQAQSAASVHIIYTEKPEGEEPEAYNIRTLSAVVGSEDAAKEVLLYNYKNAATGFSAKLTPEQVADMSKQPGVLQVVPSRTLQLHSGPGAGRLHVGNMKRGAI